MVCDHGTYRFVETGYLLPVVIVCGSNHVIILGNGHMYMYMPETSHVKYNLINLSKQPYYTSLVTLLKN